MDGLRASWICKANIFQSSRSFYKGQISQGYILDTRARRTKQLVDEGFSWTLNSKHLSGLAVDFMIIEKGQTVFESAIYGMMGTYWEDMGGIWGGNWKKRDVFHFEYNLKKRQELLKKDESDPFNY